MTLCRALVCFPTLGIRHDSMTCLIRVFNRGSQHKATQLIPKIYSTQCFWAFMWFQNQQLHFLPFFWLENLPSKKVLSYKVYLPGLYMGNWKLTKLSLTLWPRPAILLKFQPRSSYISHRHRISSQMPSLMLHGQSQQRPLKTYPMRNMCRCCSNLIQLIDNTFILTHIEFRPHLEFFHRSPPF